MSELSAFRSRGARALVLLHEARLRELVPVWRAAKAADVSLGDTGHPAYRSLEHLLQHVLGTARHYMVWICEQLELPDPEIDPVPDVASVEGELDAYVEHLLTRWRRPLADVPDDRMEGSEHTSAWGQVFTIDGMLEHAVMHPERHAFQLRELLS